MIAVLYIGDSETVISRYAVGADVFEQSYDNDNGRYLREALAGRDDLAIHHFSAAGVPAHFPRTAEKKAASLTAAPIPSIAHRAG